MGILLLQETSPGFSDQRSLYEKITAKLRRVKYSSLAEVDPEVEELDLVAPERPEDIDGEEAHDTATPMKVGQPHTVLSDGETTKPKQALTPQVWLQILSVSSVAYHKVSSDIIMSTFLALPETSQRESSPLQARGLNVSGGFGLTTSEIGTIFLSQAVVAVVAQSYLIPKLVSKMGALRVFKWILLAYPLLYILTPLTAKLPSPLSIIAVSIDLWIKVIVSSTAYVCSNILYVLSAFSTIEIPVAYSVTASPTQLPIENSWPRSTAQRPLWAALRGRSARLSRAKSSAGACKFTTSS